MATRAPPLRVALGWADKLVEEYLLFRGFMQTHRAFLGEVKHDRVHEFQVDKIVEELLRLLTSFQYHAMMDLWGFLQERFFSRLQHSYWPVIRHLELSLQRFYVVNAVQNDRVDKVREVLESEAEEFKGSKDWEPWFQLPFIRDPASDPTFHVYFTKDWASRLVVSVHNLLTTVFHDLPLPGLVTQHLHSVQLRLLENLVQDHEDARKKLEDENAKLQRTIRELQQASNRRERGVGGAQGTDAGGASGVHSSGADKESARGGGGADRGDGEEVGNEGSAGGRAGAVEGAERQGGEGRGSKC